MVVVGTDVAEDANLKEEDIVVRKAGRRVAPDVRPPAAHAKRRVPAVVGELDALQIQREANLARVLAIQQPSRSAHLRQEGGGMNSLAAG
jgi:hypothetical protein|eukprot:2698288-Prymnesium_polylepis.1